MTDQCFQGCSPRGVVHNNINNAPTRAVTDGPGDTTPFRPCSRPLVLVPSMHVAYRTVVAPNRIDHAAGDPRLSVVATLASTSASASAPLCCCCFSTRPCQSVKSLHRRTPLPALSQFSRPPRANHHLGRVFISITSRLLLGPATLSTATFNFITH